MKPRGFSLLTARTIVSENSNLAPFPSVPLWIAYLGIVPSEHSIDGNRFQGPSTKPAKVKARQAQRAVHDSTCQSAGGIHLGKGPSISASDGQHIGA